MPKRKKAPRPATSANNTVKLTPDLRGRVATAMSVEGFTVWSEFCRVALTEKCDMTEARLRTRDPEGYARMYPGVSLGTK